MQAPLLHEGGLAWRPERVSTVMVVFYVIHHRGSEKITIHALRGEGDWRSRWPPPSPGDFYPRPPWGGRRFCVYSLEREETFLSTPSVGRATEHWFARHKVDEISIHALRGEGDRTVHGSCAHYQNFYPRPPWGGRLYPYFMGVVESVLISIHALRGEGDFDDLWSHSRPVISIHALRGEGDQPGQGGRHRRRISIHALRGEGDIGGHGGFGYRSIFLSTPSVGRAT